MTEALGYLYNIYDMFIDLVFNRFQLFEGVTLGWIFVVVVVFGMMIRNILNVPKLASSRKVGKNG